MTPGTLRSLRGTPSHAAREKPQPTTYNPPPTHPQRIAMYPWPGFGVYYKDAIWNDDYGGFAGDGRGVGGIG